MFEGWVNLKIFSKVSVFDWFDKVTSTILLWFSWWVNGDEEE